MNCKDTEVVTKFTSGIRLKRRKGEKKNQSRASWKILFISFFFKKFSMNCFTFSFKGDSSSNPQGKRDLFSLKMLSGFYEEGV